MEEHGNSSEDLSISITMELFPLSKKDYATQTMYEERTDFLIFILFGLPDRYNFPWMKVQVNIWILIVVVLDPFHETSSKIYTAECIKSHC